MAEASGKDKVVKAGFEYRRTRSSRTRYEVKVAKAKADEAGSEKNDAMAAAAEALGVKEAKAEETTVMADEKSATARKA